jgi:hypothetical protein
MSGDGRILPSTWHFLLGIALIKISHWTIHNIFQKSVESAVDWVWIKEHHIPIYF